jgi:hypothetical protein
MRETRGRSRCAATRIKLEPPSRGPACWVHSEGRARRVRWPTLDNPSRFCGHDKRAPPVLPLGVSRRDALVASGAQRWMIHLTSAGTTGVPLRAGVTSTSLRLCLSPHPEALTPTPWPEFTLCDLKSTDVSLTWLRKNCRNFRTPANRLKQPGVALSAAVACHRASGAIQSVFLSRSSS